MYHSRFRGNHYEIGFHWGSLLASHKNIILDNVPYPITEERMQFADACIPIYEKFFPEILEEIKGLADGQKCSLKKLQAFLLSMYAMPPACSCSCFAVSNENHILLGRNSDFLTALEKTNLNVIYNFTSNSYSFTGNTTSFIEIEDGINEKGLAVGLTSIYPPAVKPGFNAGLLLRFFLEKCQTTEEVIYRAKNLPISSAQTFTVADTSGDIAVLECYCNGIEVIQPAAMKNYVCATNLFHSLKLQHLNNPQTDSWDSNRRNETLGAVLSKCSEKMSLEEAADLLSGKKGFLCQYDRKTGKDTVWSVIYDLKNHKIYRTEKNPSRQAYREDNRFSF